MTTLEATKSKNSSGVTRSGRLFVLELSGDRIHSMNPMGPTARQTPLGTYQGMTDQVVLSRTPGSFGTVLVPRGSSKPEWLER